MAVEPLTKVQNSSWSEVIASTTRNCKHRRAAAKPAACAKPLMLSILAGKGKGFGTEEGTFGPLLRAKFHPNRCNVSPLWGEKPQNRPLSKFNTGRFALRAMLPVISGHNTNIDTRAAFIKLHRATVRSWPFIKYCQLHSATLKL